MSLTALLFVALFVVLSILCVVRHPIYGLYLYVAVFYLDPVNRWWSTGLPDLRWSLLSAAITCIALFANRKDRRETPWRKGPALLFAIYVCYMWIQTPWVVYPQEHWLALNIFTKFLVVIYMIHACVDTKDRLAGFLLVHGLGCMYLGFVAWTVGGGGRLDGVGGPGINDANSLAMQFSTGVLAAGAYYFAESSRRRYLAVLIIPFALNGLVMTGSRGGFLALAAGAVTVLFMRPAKTLRVFVVYGIVGAGLFSYLASDFFLERLTTITSPIQEPENVDDSIATRLFIFRAQWQMAKDHPLGVGHAGTTGLSFQYIPIEHHSGEKGRSSHNTIMSSLVDQGYLGAVAWIAIIVLIWRRLRTTRAWANAHADTSLAWLNAGVAAMLVAVVMAGMFAPLIRTEVYVWILALACSTDHLMRPICSAAETSGTHEPGTIRPGTRHRPEVARNQRSVKPTCSRRIDFFIEMRDEALSPKSVV